MRSNSKFALFNEKKFFFIKIQKIQSTNFHEKFHVKWKLFVRIMKNQFVINQCDQKFSNFDQSKILYVEIFLKKNILVQFLWQTKVIENFDRIYIWLKFKKFLKINIKEAIRRKKNVFDKYMKYEQKLKQNIAKYEIQRIALKVELIVNLKFNDEMNLQNFITNLREENKNYVMNQDLTIKIFIINRLKNKKNREYKKRSYFHINKQNIIKNKINNDFNKRKKNNEKFDVEEDKFKKNNNNNNKEKEKDKKLKFDNFNRNLIKFKLYRWIKIEMSDINVNNKCFKCDKTNHNKNDCIEISKSNKHSKKIIFDFDSKN